MPRVPSPVLPGRPRCISLLATPSGTPPPSRRLVREPEILQLSTCRSRADPGPSTPAELSLDLLQDGWGSGEGEEGPDTQRNIDSEVQFWVDCEMVCAHIGLSLNCAHSGGTVQPPDDPDSIFADPPTCTLKTTVVPLLFFRLRSCSIRGEESSDSCSSHFVPSSLKFLMYLKF